MLAPMSDIHLYKERSTLMLVHRTYVNSNKIISSSGPGQGKDQGEGQKGQSQVRSSSEN